MSPPTNSSVFTSGSKRFFTSIRVDAIDVITPRGRGSRQYQANVKSIADNGLYKPILVNARDFDKTKRYQLICGEGRLRAHRELKKEFIKAEIVKVDSATAHIMTLGENMTKCPPAYIEYAYALLEMHEKGASISELEKITGHPWSYVRAYLTLVQRGEERLIKGVEQGVFTLEFAMKVADSGDGAIQHVLMNAFDAKLITARHVESVRKVLTARMQQGIAIKNGIGKTLSSRESYSVEDLKRDIAKLTKEKEKFVEEANSRETRLFKLAEVTRILRTNPDFLELLRRHKLDQLPALQGKYGF
jgi:ParB family chromosome partitioning protein